MDKVNSVGGSLVGEVGTVVCCWIVVHCCVAAVVVRRLG